MVRWGIILRRFTPAKTFLLFIFLVPFYNELLSYVIHSWKWPILDISESDELEQQRILFVADPQLQGFRDEPALLGYLTRWDADRYLHRTFQLATSHVKPDIVVYLGDLLDEGSIAEDQEYSIYHKRFSNIFQSAPEVQHVYISGDNDVGGEGFDQKTEFKEKRFKKYFKEQSLVSTKYIDFICGHINVGQEIFKAEFENEMTTIDANAKKPIRVLLNHMNILTYKKEHFTHLLRKIKPSIIISGHVHVAHLFTCLDCYEDKPSGRGHNWLGGSRPMSDYSVFTFNIANTSSVHEIVVPACSYRMGVPKMGYGAAVIDKYGHMKYTVLWLPSRYLQLYAYVFLLVCLIGWTCLYHLMVRLRFFSAK